MYKILVAPKDLLFFRKAGLLANSKRKSLPIRQKANSDYSQINCLQWRCPLPKGIPFSLEEINPLNTLQITLFNFSYRKNEGFFCQALLNKTKTPGNIPGVKLI